MSAVDEVAEAWMRHEARLAGIHAVPLAEASKSTRSYWRRETRRLLSGLVAAMLWKDGAGHV